MVDFLKANPSITMDEYLWKLSVPMIRIMGTDFTRVEYLSEEQVEENKKKQAAKKDISSICNDLGIPIA